MLHMYVNPSEFQTGNPQKSSGLSSWPILDTQKKMKMVLNMVT